MKRFWQGLVWYVRQVSGDADYERYAAHQRRVHGPDSPVMTARQFQRWRTGEADRDPRKNFRCC